MRRLLTKIGLGGIASLALAMIIGRLTGFAREMLIAAQLGMGREADFVITILALPDFLTNVLLSGGIAAALIPRFVSLSGAQADILFRRMSFFVGTLFTFVAMFFLVDPAVLLRLLYAGYSAGSIHVSSTIFVAIATSFVLAALSGVSTSYLNSRGRYFLPGLGTMFFNLPILVVLIWGPGNILTWIAVAVATGAAIRWGSQIALIPQVMIGRMSGEGVTDGALYKAFVSGLLASLLNLLMPVSLRSAASLVAPGELAAVNYTQKLIELPMGVIFSSLATVAFTRFSRILSTNSEDKALGSLVQEFRLSFCLAFLCSLITVLYASTIASILFGHGSMAANDVERVAWLLRFLAPSIVPAACILLFANWLNACHRAGSVFRATLFSMLLFVPFLVVAIMMRKTEILLLAGLVQQLSLAGMLANRSGILLFGRRAGSEAVFSVQFIKLILAVLLITVIFNWMWSLLWIYSSLMAVLMAFLSFFSSVFIIFIRWKSHEAHN